MKKLGNKPLYKPKGKIYFIPDIHGDYNKLIILWNKILLEIKNEDHLVFLGDYIGSIWLHSVKGIWAIFSAWSSFFNYTKPIGSLPLKHRAIFTMVTTSSLWGGMLSIASKA